jgi:uncharacterized Zn-binding protein involved in type VI secretion
MPFAAKAGDQTSHGGTVGGPGAPTVLIHGQPAICAGDLQVCPLSDGPKPHGGGPITAGSATVLIGGRPAARAGDFTQCAGPPGTIVGPGHPDVMIGP